MLALAVLIATGSATAEPGTVEGKRAQARQILAQVRQIDSQLSHAIEAYNLANVKLDRIERDLDRNRRHLVLARSNLVTAQQRLEERVVAIYTSGDDNSTLSVLLGSQSLDELLRQIDAANRVSEQDARIVRQVIETRKAVARHAVELRNARSAQKRIVDRKAAERASIERQLAQREALLSSVRGEIERMQAAERSRQLALARRFRGSVPAQSAASGVGAAAVGSEGQTVAPPSRYGGVVGIAMRYLGIPYKWGGASPSTGFDCSGFVMFVYAQVGVSLPHNAAAQYGYGTPVSRSQLQPGDLVFFNGLGHNGIYIGGGNFIHAPHTGDVVKISSLSGWYSSTWVGARRL